MKYLISSIFLVYAILGVLAVPPSPLQESGVRRSTVQPSHYHSDHSYVSRRRLNYDQVRSIDYYNQSLTNQRSLRKNQVLLNREGSNSNYNFTNGDIDESVNRKASTTGIPRTYGKGRAQTTKKGEVVAGPNANRRKNIQRTTIAPTTSKLNENELKANAQLEQCTCPPHQTVVATKGNNFFILPEPCPSNIWTHLWGPRPGTQIGEGLHTIQGTIGPHREFCQYQYQVLVHRCELLRVNDNDTTIQCSANEIWGSKCTVSCGHEKEPVGPAVLECMEDLKWSNPMPRCKSKTDCPMPKVKSNSKVWCETANKIHTQKEFLPNGSNCRFNKNGKEMSINCKNGAWRLSRKIKDSLPKKNNEKLKPKVDKNDNACNPNPCKNGGTCLRSELNKEQPICMCRPQTHGMQCDMRQCEYNFCQNDGVCFFQNEERTCFCLPEYSGDKCQYYVAQ